MSESISSRLTNAVAKLVARFIDNSEISGQRLTAIEDRLAMIYGGPGGEEARLAAYESINAKRRGTGVAPLEFTLK